MKFGPLTQLVFVPLLASLLIASLPRKLSKLVFPLGCFTSAFALGLSFWLYSSFDPKDPAAFQFVENYPWIDSFNVTYFVGIDGISLVLVLLTNFLSAVALFYSSYVVAERKKEFVASMLILQSAMLGTFVAIDVFLFYVFWEAMLVPMYVLIGVFGGPRRIYATLKFFIYTMFGSLLMLVALLLLYNWFARDFGYASTALTDLYQLKVPVEAQRWMFGAFLLAFAIKIPMFPFHTWLPDAHVEAPTAGSVILAGVLLKMGGYGLIRFAMPLFPEAAIEYAPWMAVLALIGILYGAWCAFAQEDLKKLVAYSSVSHMGFVVLGLAAITVVGFEGAVFQMVAHGLSTGTLFLLVGMIYERRHTRMMVDFGGLAQVTPRYATAFLLATLASIGLPGLCGFVGEFLVLAGSFNSSALVRPAWMTGLAVLGIVLGAVYMLGVYGKVFLGPIRFEENRKVRDLRWFEGISLALPLIAAVALGIRPNWILDYVEPASRKIVAKVQGMPKVAEVPGVAK